MQIRLGGHSLVLDCNDVACSRYGQACLFLNLHNITTWEFNLIIKGRLINQYYTFCKNIFPQTCEAEGGGCRLTDNGSKTGWILVRMVPTSLPSARKFIVWGPGQQRCSAVHAVQLQVRYYLTAPAPPPPPQCNDVCRCRYIKPRKWFTCQLFSPPTHNRKQKQLNHEGYGEYPRLLLVSNMYQQIQCNGFLSRSSRLFVLYREQCDAMRQKTLLWPQHGPPFLRSSAILKNCQHIFGR